MWTLLEMLTEVTVVQRIQAYLVTIRLGVLWESVVVGQDFGKKQIVSMEKRLRLADKRLTLL